MHKAKLKENPHRIQSTNHINIMITTPRKLFSSRYSLKTMSVSCNEHSRAEVIYTNSKMYKIQFRSTT